MTQPKQVPDSPRRPPRLLALDPGERRIGVSIGDELGLYAHPRPAIKVRGTDATVEAVARIISDDHIDEVIVGRPLSMSGGESEQTRRADRFAESLRARVTIPVSRWDERLSSVQAARSVTGSHRQRSGDLDSAAASVVLQSVLDARRSNAERR